MTRCWERVAALRMPVPRQHGMDTAPRHGEQVREPTPASVYEQLIGYGGPPMLQRGDRVAQILRPSIKREKASSG